MCSERTDTAWLGRRDSNLEMLFCKMPFEMPRGFRLNSEHIATRDLSRVRCGDGEKHPPPALVPLSRVPTGLCLGICEIDLRKLLTAGLEAHCLL